MVPLPHNMKNYFQPLDLTVNLPCKLCLDDKYQICYAEQVQAYSKPQACEFSAEQKMVRLQF